MTVLSQDVSPGPGVFIAASYVIGEVTRYAIRRVPLELNVRPNTSAAICPRL